MEYPREKTGSAPQHAGLFHGNICHMAVNRVQVIWTGTPTVGGGLSTFYFDDGTGTPAQQVAAVALFLSSTEARRSTLTSWVTAADVATLNVGTGALEAITSTTQSSGVGTNAAAQMPPVVQGLLRGLTSIVTGGRLLRARIFLPGTTISDATLGAPTATYKSGYDAAAATLISSANADWAAWSRTHGVRASIVSANTWNKFAELRSRRD